MLEQQQKLVLSPYMAIYDLVVPKDNLLRKIIGLIDKYYLDTSIFGYKTHIAMTEERIITAATITTGEKNDGKELESLINKTLETGMVIDTIIGDAAYSEKGIRPNRSANQAILKCKAYMDKGYRWAEDIDLEKYFDTVNHDKLFGLIYKEVKDIRIISLIRKYLNAGVMIKGTTKTRRVKVDVKRRFSKE